MAFTDPVYAVPEWVRVRREDFGLLFYDTQSARLTFVRSGDKLVPPSFTGPRRVLGVRSREDGVSGPGGDDRPGPGLGDPALSQLLDSLAARGLIFACEAE